GRGASGRRPGRATRGRRPRAGPVSGTPRRPRCRCNRNASRVVDSSAIRQGEEKMRSVANRRRDIADVAYGFMGSKALFAALEIGVFAALAEGPRTADDLAAAFGLDVRRLATLLRALAGLGLVVEDGDGFRNAPAAQRHLVPGARGDIGEYYRLQVGRQIYPALVHLDAGIAGAGVAFSGFDELMGRCDTATTFTVG